MIPNESIKNLLVEFEFFHLNALLKQYITKEKEINH
jgi:hypothetical protein